MSDPLDLPGLLMAPRSPCHIVGWQHAHPVQWEKFLARVRAWQDLLRCIPGRNFALYIADSIEFAAALFGAWQAGKTAYLPADTLPATCLALQGAVDGFLGEFPAEWTPLAPSVQDGALDTQGLTPLAPDFVGLVIYTSGSTGAPQAIPKKLSQLAAEVVTLEELFGHEAGAADVLATVSHQHIYGLLFKVLWPLASGRAIHAHRYEFFEQMVPALESRHCVLVASPAHLKRLPDLPAWASVTHRLRAVFSSGGPLPPEVAQVTQRLLTKVPIEIYGSSETGGIAWRQRRAMSDDSWTPMPSVSWRISAGDRVLQVRSAHLPDTAWFPMGDRAVAVPGARFLLQGRVDRIVKIEEKRISLDVIEQCLTASPLVAEVRVLAFGDQRRRIAAFVVPSSPGHHALIDVGKLAFSRMLRNTLADVVERVALPRRWRFLAALPVNAQGKTTHAELLALLDGSASRPILPRHRMLERNVVRAVFELTAPHDLAYFDGHFPGAPVLPGVVQVDWAITYGRQCFDLPPMFQGIHALKFQHVIRPDMPVTLELLHDPARSSLTFRYSSQHAQHASGKILFGASHV